MDCDPVEIPLAEIDASDLTYQISTNEDKTDLAPSIGAIGLLHSPFLVRKGPLFSILSGFRRVFACRSLEKKAISARILPSELPQECCARIAIADNALQRPLNLVEQSRSYRLILRSIHPKRKHSAVDVSEMAASVGLSGDKKALDHIRPIADMPNYLQRSILNGTMALPIATQVCRWEEMDARLLNNLFEKVSPGLNNQRELLSLISEISIRDEVPVGKILGGDIFRAILSDEKTSAPQKLNSIRSHLKKVRFPSLSRRESDFSRSVKSVKLNARVQITPPRFFESQTFKISLQTDSRTQLRSLMPELQKLIDHPDILPE